MKLFFLLAGVLLFLAGCGSNFEWFPQGGAFSNSSTSTSGPKPAVVSKTLQFPAGVTKISDIAYDGSTSFWLLTWVGAASTSPNALVKIDATTGAFLSQINAISWPFTILDGSSLAFDGSTFWITSNGSNGGVPARNIYQILSDGRLYKTYDCPTTTGFCQGLGRDTATPSFWTAGSDNLELVNFQGAAGVITSSKTYTGLWTTQGVSDIGYNSATGEVLVVKNGVISIKAGSIAGFRSFILPGTGKGDYDNSLFWVIDNDAKLLKGIDIRQ